ncbi:ShlB/FhaC/HecB family hemolysin secretion/activation protein [Paucibacter sp. XJ19-41]|uniref:ShlB/FhaC/HecB family hemolysin secretion/activation protein n=1 Tax=Paucibacter sp. XJ19-41 TaxID=2927824 RepID=UPI0023490C76|nr:ShlB/FhaC/HecB family hemolysin secretion/activation protein [Paucibacter sp. XJ19-41]MDC6167117.1 ShlB/FhaC/HecB family hemolysin secretion/activation protein [Paucibacter sp. XJ19-41]
MASKKKKFVLAGMALIPMALAAAPDAGQLLNEQQRLNSGPGRPTLQRPAEAPATALDRNAGFKALISRVRFSGAEGLADAAELQAWVAGALGQRLSHAELQALAGRVTSRLQAKGFMLARAYLPRQDLSEGELEIAVLAGRLESGPQRVQLGNRSPVADAQLHAIAQAALPAGPVRGEDLERALLLINDLAGVSARSSLERGSEPGSSRLLIKAEPTAALRGNVSLDNFSNRYTGAARASALLSLANPLQRGDSLGLSLSASTGNKAASASYLLPLTPQGLRLSLGASLLAYKIGAELKALDLHGQARSVGAGLSYPLQRSRAGNVWAQLDIEAKQLSDDSASGNLRERRLQRLQFALFGNRWDELGAGGSTEWSLGGSAGKLNLAGNALDQTVDGLTARTQGGYSKASLRLARTQALDAAGDWAVYGSLSAQLAGGNLDSSEKFGLGGPGGVRAYAVGEGSGDAGWLGSVELRREFRAGERLRGQALAFVDGGRVSLHASPWAGALAAGKPNGYQLGGVGLGLNLYAERWQMRAAWARAVGGNAGRQANGLDADGRSARSRLWLQASLNY